MLHLWCCLALPSLGLLSGPSGRRLAISLIFQSLCSFSTLWFDLSSSFSTFFVFNLYLDTRLHKKKQLCVTFHLFSLVCGTLQILLQPASLSFESWALNCVWQCCWWGPGILLMLVIFILRTISLCICIRVAPDLSGICSFIHMQYICKGIISLFSLQAAGKKRTHLMNCVVPVFNVWMICRKPFLFFLYSWFKFQMKLRKWKEEVRKVRALKNKKL